MSSYSCDVMQIGNRYNVGLFNGWNYAVDKEVWFDTLDQCIEYANSWNCVRCDFYGSDISRPYDLFWTYAHNGKRETAYFEVDSCISEDFEQYLIDTNMTYRTEPGMVLTDGKKLDLFAVECSEAEEYILKGFLTDRKMIVCSY